MAAARLFDGAYGGQGRSHRLAEVVATARISADQVHAGADGPIAAGMSLAAALS